MNHFKSHRSPISALELHRAYVYLAQSQWLAIEALRADTGLSVSQLVSQLIIAATAAKESNERTHN